MLLDEIRGLSVKNCILFHFAENSHRFSLPTESAPTVRFCLRNNCTVPSGKKFSAVFRTNGIKALKVFVAKRSPSVEDMSSGYRLNKLFATSKFTS